MQQQRFEPMSIGRIFDKTFAIYRNNFVRFITIVAIIQVPLALVGMLSNSLMRDGVAEPPDSAMEQSVDEDSTRARDSYEVQSDIPPAAVFAGIGVTIILTLIGNMLCQAALIKSVSESYLDREISVGEAYRFALPKVLTLIGAGLLVGLIVGLGFLLLVVPGVIFSLWLALTTPCIVVESQGVTGGMSRSKALVSGNLGKVFLVGLLAAVIAWVISFPLGLVGGLLTLFVPSDSEMTRLVVNSFSGMIGQILAMPIGASASILLYYDLRIRKEGFDLEMLAQSMSRDREIGYAAQP